MLATAGFASNNSLTAAGASPLARSTPAPNPASAAWAALPGNAGPTTIHWDKFYDRSGKMLSGGRGEAVGAESLYWKDYNDSAHLKSSPKVQNPSPTNRTAMAFHDQQSTTCMDPTGDYVYEVGGTSLYRYSTVDGSMMTYTLAYTGGIGCATDGQYIYRPRGASSKTIDKYTMTGTFVDSTTTDVSCDAYSISCCRDTVWFTNNRSSPVTLYGYACSRFAGDSINYDATWDVGSGNSSVGPVTWDGYYFYLTWIGTTNATLKRFYADRTLYSTGTVSIDPRAVMCRKSASFKVLFAGTEGDNPTLQAQIVSASGGQITSVDYFAARNGPLPAYALYQQGYRVIITFGGNYLWGSGDIFGDSLAAFVDLGGGALNMTYTTCAGGDWCIGGRYKDQYMPVPTVTYDNVHCPSITILDSLHPIMNGVTAIGNFTCEPYTMDVRSPTYSVRLANWDVTNSYIECAAFDSGGRRTVFLGYHPNYNPGGTGQWLTQLVNALIWMGNPVLDANVTVPNGGENWVTGSVHNIAWSQTSNGIKDSIYYSTDAGASWTGVAYYDPPPAPLQHVWTVPSTLTSQARVKVVTWDTAGVRVEDASDSDFTIAALVHDVSVLQVIQPVDTVDSGTTVVPTAAVKNFGQVQETFPLRFSIGGFYTADTSVTIDPGMTDTVAFLQWVAGPVGAHAVRCSTRLDSDQNSDNDYTAGMVVVVPPPPGIEQSKSSALPRVFALHQPRPNPSTSGAQIRYDLPRSAHVELNIYGVSGTLVRRLVGGAQTAGYRSANWNGCDDRGRMVAPGVYYCRFTTGDFRAGQKLVVGDSREVDSRR